MRNNRKLKLKICSSNVKNFPKDFFADLHEKEGVMTPKKNDAGYRVDFNDSLIKLRPCTLNNVTKVCSPKEYLNKSGVQDNKNFTLDNSLFSVQSEENCIKLNRRSKMKSLSLQRNFNSETNSRAFKRQIKLKDSFVNADSSPQYIQDVIFNCDDKARRAKSIAKRPMQHQRNVPQTITSRHKNISSANAYLLSQNIRMQNMINDSCGKPEERFSDSKLLSFNKKSFIMEKRNKQFIKPFCLIQQSNLIRNIYLNQTINKAKIGEFTLPDIFSKESIQPSTEGTENSYIECQHLSWDSDEDKDQIQSVFLTKLENSLCTKPTTHTNGKFIALGKLAFCLIVYVSIYLIK